jgi:hypothetical protein
MNIATKLTTIAIAAICLSGCISDESDSSNNVCQSAAACKEFAQSNMPSLQGLVKKMDSGNVIGNSFIGNGSFSISAITLKLASSIDSSKAYSFREKSSSNYSTASKFYIVYRTLAPSVSNDSVYADLDKSYSSIMPYGTGYEKISDNWYIAVESPNQN